MLVLQAGSISDLLLDRHFKKQPLMDDSAKSNVIIGSFDYDVAIIGAGSAGYAAARTSTAAGLRTVVIDGGAEVGGLCILRGCMPTKSLLYAAEAMHFAGKLDTWGILAGNVGFDFGQVMARKNAFIEDLATIRRKELTAGKFEFIRGRARFVDPHTVELDGRVLLTSASFVITTGSSVAPPPLPEFHETGYLTSDDALELTRLPESLVILGGGAVAVEFAQFFARFGVRVTLLQRSGQLLSDFDTDIAEDLEKVFRRDGIEVFTNTKIIGVGRGTHGKKVSFEHEGQVRSVAAEEIMMAIGRDPNTTSLDLDKAGVATEHGRIVADECMRTSAPHIYAAGDCTGPHAIVHLAVRQGEIAAHNIMHPGSIWKRNDRLLLAVIFTDPQVAQVGLTEKTAAKLGIPCLVASYPFSELGKSVIMDSTTGHVKLLADPKSGEILGGACVGPLGGELIHEIVAAMAKQMTVHELVTLPHYHPTLAEIWTYPAEELAARITPQE
jgi:pyruvate/2-oxoglutarate dehydrogenase complex dihydrolipoamide dehydrogenase (E3) component